MAEPIHWWKLTENANDYIGSLHLSNNGGVTFSALGAYFNGSSYLSATKTIGQRMSLSIWTKRDPTVASGIIGFDNASAIRWMRVTGTSILVYCYSGGGGGYFYATDSSSTSNYNLYSLVWDNLNLSFYINATLLQSGSYSIPSCTTFKICESNTAASIYSKDARIYDYPTPASEVSAMYAAGPNPVEFVRRCYYMGGM